MFMKLLSVLKMRLLSAPVERKQIVCRPLANAPIAPSQYCSSSSWGIVQRGVGGGKLFLPNIGMVERECTEEYSYRGPPPIID